MLQKIPRKNIIDRFESLPESLKDAIFSASTSKEVERIGQLDHLDEDKIAKLALLTGRVLLGFLDIDDVAGAIRDYLELPPELAGSLARELRRKIFSFYESDIIKVYSPFGTGEVRVGDKIFKEKEAVPFKITTEEARGAAPISIAPPTKPETRMEAPKIIPPSKLTDGKSFAAPSPLPVKPGQAIPSPVSAPMPAPSTPFMLHTEEKISSITETKPIQSFEARIEAPTQRAEARPLISAELELGGETAQPTGTRKQPEIAKTPITAPRTVHYSDFRTPVSPFESKTGAPQEIKPIKPEVQMTPTAPRKEAMQPAPQIIPSSPELWPKVNQEQKDAPSQQTTPLIAPSPQVKIEGNTVDLRQK